ncbi:MAG TPA: hypothetical protein VEK79_09735 [Thermoanaerobaculia bacterium]|nr:hypothetical protein [Thermoanaerobaculia bacterium]
MKRLLPLVLFAAFAVAAVGPIRNYDFFWHLATGRWIVEQFALPLTDPFAVASDRHPWINGEWLFEIVAYLAHNAIGLTGMSFVRAILAASIFTLVYRSTSGSSEYLGVPRRGKTATPRNSEVPEVLRDTVLVTSIAFAGAMQTFDLRPSSAAMLFVVLAIAARSWLAHAIVAMLWINIHPSALLAPGIAVLSTRRVTPAFASALALLVNPYGWRAIAAPIELMSFVQSGAFVNAEWLPSRVTQFPLLYACVIGGGIAFIVRRNEQGAWWRVLLFAGFAFLAIRHVRNQGLFFAAFPLLMPRIEVRERLANIAAAIAIVFVAIGADHRLGVAPERFPLQAIARLRATQLGGNIYNADQFGGFLIWSFYPQRRVLTDGRNELHRTYIAEYARARGDQRAWRALLAKYRVDLAVDEYREPLPVIDAVTGARRVMPASLAYWSRSEWALIAHDNAAMVFARRKAFAADEIQEWEIRGVVPDAR